jgi:hypothetical protein
MPTPQASDLTPGQIDRLVYAWKNHFFSADHELKWIAAEVEHSVWLTSNTLLAGRIDTLGENESGPFFGEWKTANPREAKTWKQVWRMNPQSLTYGVLANDWFAANKQVACSQFTVRKAFKSTPPTFDHAWFSYDENELTHWRHQLIQIADQIRGGGAGPWETNWTACFQFGINYPCPHFESGCSKMNWDVPVDAVRRVPHLDIERRLNEDKNIIRTPGAIHTMELRIKVPDDLVILDATRVKDWFRCREMFRRNYVENVGTPMTEALQLGIDAHELWGNYYQSLVKETP